MTSSLIEPKTILIQNRNEIEFTTKIRGALSFGVVSPSQTSDVIVVKLRVENSTRIGNIQIALVDTGGIDFTTTRFGISSSPYYNANTVPTAYFQGVNSELYSGNENNVSVDNQNRTESNFVYLNVKYPNDMQFTSGVVRYKWFFDYVG